MFAIIGGLSNFYNYYIFHLIFEITMDITSDSCEVGINQSLLIIIESLGVGNHGGTHLIFEK